MADSADSRSPRSPAQRLSRSPQRLSRSPQRSHSPQQRSHERSMSRSPQRNHSPHSPQRAHSQQRAHSPMNMSDNAPNQGNNLYIGNISSKTKAEDLKKLFSKYGKVTNCQIMFDPHTQRFRGFGFIAFEDNASADEAKEQLQNYEIDGKKIFIEKAKRGRPRTPTPGRYHGAKTRKPTRFMGRRQPDRYDPRMDRYDPPRYDRRDYGRDYRGYQDRFYDRPYDRGYQDRGYDRYDRGYDRYDRSYDRYERDRRPRYHYSSGRRSPV